jgi:hypothetical protein
VRPSKKFVAQSSGLSITEKTSSAIMKIAGKKTSLPLWAGEMQPKLQRVHWTCLTRVRPPLMANLPLRCHPRKSPIPKSIPKSAPKPFGPSAVKGNFK